MALRQFAPNSQQCQIIDTIIFDELVFGTLKPESRKIYIDVMRELAEQGAQGIVLGCTEIEMLVKPEDIPELSLFDTTALHCQKATNLALGVELIPVDPVTSAP